MELFSLLAKLTLDSKEFDKELSEAQRDANNFEMPETPSLDLDAEEFNDSIEAAEITGKGFGSSMESIFGQIKTALTATGVVAAIAGIVNGLKEAVNLTAETADGIDKGSKRLNISRTAYQEWDHALKQSGASITDLQKGVLQFNNYISSFQPGAVVKDAEEAAEGAGGDMAQAFARLNISVKDANGNLKSTEELINESLLALAGFEGTSEERGALVTKLFGRGGNNLNALLDEGVDGVKALLSEASDLGLVMSDEDITNAVAYGDAVANLNSELDAIKMAFVSDIIPALTDAVTWLTDFLTKLNPRLQTNSVYAVFEQINKKTVTASKQVDEATATASDLITKLQEMGNYWTLDEEGKMTWDALAAKALELFPQLSQYIDTDGKKINGNTQEILNNVKAWALLEKQRLLSTAMEEKQAAVADQLTKAYEKGAEAREKEFEAVGKLDTAVKEMNTALEDNDMLKTLLRGQFGTDVVTKDNAVEMLNWIKKNGYDTKGMGAGSVDEWKALNNQASELRTEAEKMKDEANKAQDSLADEQKYLMEEMGYTDEEIEAVTKDLDAYIKKLKEVPSDVTTTFHTEYDDRGYNHSYAIGSSYIPYDQMALLHRGERVLTATENRHGTGDSIDYTRLEDSIVESIRTGMADAQVTAVVTDQQVGKSSNRYNGTELDSRRFRP